MAGKGYLLTGPKNNRWINIDLIKLIELRKEGKTIKELAEYFKASTSTISNRIKQNGLKQC